jgi:NADH:ubiquinone oxidoreductase subunit 6 (subunit J)
MTFQTGLFYIFAAILVFAAVRVVTARNPVHAVLWLVLAFFTAAAHWLMLQAEFLAIVLVLVYVGAVMVLFLFVVMMLDVNFDSMRTQFKSYVPVGATVGALVLIEMALTLVGGRVSAGSVPTCRGSRRGWQYESARVARVHGICVSVRNCRRRPAGRNHRSDRAHAPHSPGQQVSEAGRSGESPAAG